MRFESAIAKGSSFIPSFNVMLASLALYSAILSRPARPESQSDAIPPFSISFGFGIPRYSRATFLRRR